MIVIGLILRLATFLERRSLWIDEARLALNIVGRPYIALLPPLDHDQSAPLLFLWLERLSTQLFGVSEWSLRAAPLVAGIAIVLLAYSTMRHFLGRRSAIFAAALIAVSPQLVYYSNEVKQYSVEVLLTLLLLAGTARYLKSPPGSSGGGGLLALGVVAPWLSAPSVFILFPTWLTIAWSSIDRHRSEQRFALSTGVIWGASSLVAYVSVYQVAENAAYMRRFWAPAFLSSDNSELTSRARAIGEEILWSLFVGRGPEIQRSLPADILVGSIAVLLASVAVIGALRLSRTLPRSFLTLSLGPLILVLTASAVGLYPLGVRTLLFAFPILCVLVAAGLSGFVEVRQGASARFAQALICVPFITAPMVWSTRNVFEGNPREHVRPLIAELHRARHPSEPLYLSAGSIPAWAYYTTDWKNPDAQHLAFLNHIASPGGSAFQNAPSRGRSVAREGDNLWYDSPRGKEIYGVFTGAEVNAMGTVSRTPDVGWAENEASRIRRLADSRAWVLMLHFTPGEGELLTELQRQNARVILAQYGNGTALIHVEFPSDQR